MTSSQIRFAHECVEVRDTALLYLGRVATPPASDCTSVVLVSEAASDAVSRKLAAMA